MDLPVVHNLGQKFNLILGVTISAFTLGCSPVIPPDDTAEILSGTTSRYSLAGGAFSLSPNEDYLFSTNFDPLIHEGDEAEPVRRTFVINLETLVHKPVGFGPEAEKEVEQFGVLAEVGCWSGSDLYITTQAPRGLFFDATAMNPQWAVSTQVPCTRLERRHPISISVASGTDGSARIIADSSNLTLAEHPPAWPGGTGVSISSMVMDEAGRWLAYGVTRPRGSFAGNVTLYLVDLADNTNSARQLASPALWPRFGRSHLYAQVRNDSGRGGEWVLVRWSLSALAEVNTTIQ